MRSEKYILNLVRLDYICWIILIAFEWLGQILKFTCIQPLSGLEKLAPRLAKYFTIGKSFKVVADILLSNPTMRRNGNSMEYLHK